MVSHLHDGRVPAWRHTKMAICEMAPSRENRCSQMNYFAQTRNAKCQRSIVATGSTVRIQCISRTAAYACKLTVVIAEGVQQLFPDLGMEMISLVHIFSLVPQPFSHSLVAAVVLVVTAIQVLTSTSWFVLHTLDYHGWLHYC
jgi:hypothetical protein